MLSINIKTSESNYAVIKELTQKFPTGTAENIVARVALAYSLASGKTFSISGKPPYNSKGKEYKDNVLFNPAQKRIFVGLISQRYGVRHNDNSIPKYVKYHIDHGLESMAKIFQDAPGYSLLDFLMDHLDRGIEHLDELEAPVGHVENRNQAIVKTDFSEPILLEIGRTTDEESIRIDLNNTRKFKNMHMAVAGKSGTGKTQFAKYFLQTLIEATNGKVNFAFLDFKGVSASDREKLEPFLKATRTELVDSPHTPFPINPLAFIDNVNENNRIIGINKFVDILASYQNLGVRQKQILKNAVVEVFHDLGSGKYPNMAQVYEKVVEEQNGREDGLTELMQRLSEVDIFHPSGRNNGERFLNQNYYLSLSGDLPDNIRYAAVFLLINYIYNTFMNMGDAPVSDSGHVAMRYVLVIDEAHVIFKEKKARQILESMLREIRSRGVSVFLLSQGIQEFAQPDFDLSSQSELTFLMDVNEKSDKRKVQRFLGLGSKELVKVMRSLEELQEGEAVARVKGIEIGERFVPWKYWEKY